MKRFTLISRQNCTRWIFICGVLAGLFFSTGEGVRLLPFAITEGDNSQNASSTLEKNLKSYAVSAHNSGNCSSLKSEFQKQNKQYHPAGGHLTFNWLIARAGLFSHSVRNLEITNLSHHSGFLTSPSDRAPPLV